MTKILSSYAVHTAAKMPSPPPAPLPSMSTGHRFIPSAREAGEWQSVPLLYLRVTKRTSVMFSESKVIQLPRLS